MKNIVFNTVYQHETIGPFESKNRVVNEYILNIISYNEWTKFIDTFTHLSLIERLTSLQKSSPKIEYSENDHNFRTNF